MFFSNMQISNFSLLFPLWAQWKAFLYKEIQFQYAKLVTCKLENLVDFSLITRFYCIYKRSLLSILLTKLVNHCICIKGCDYQNTFTLWIHVRLNHELLLMSIKASSKFLNIYIIRLTLATFSGYKEPGLTSKEMVRHVHHVFIWSPWFSYGLHGFRMPN